MYYNYFNDFYEFIFIYYNKKNPKLKEFNNYIIK